MVHVEVYLGGGFEGMKTIGSQVFRNASKCQFSLTYRLKVILKQYT